MALSVYEVLCVLSDQHSEMRPGTHGGKTTYDGMNHIVLAVGQSHLDETNPTCFELPYVASDP
jgi:hypothetical protein